MTNVILMLTCSSGNLTFFVAMGRGGMGGVSSAGGSGAGRVYHT